MGVGRGCLGGGFPVGGWEDAERDGDAGFKVQIGDLSVREEAASPQPSVSRKEDKKIPLGFYERSRKEREEGKTVFSRLLELWLSIEFLLREGVGECVRKICG